MNREKSIEGRIRITIKNRGQHLVTKEFSSFPVVVGRDSNCQISISDVGYLSRTHAMLSLLDGKIVVHDLGSRHGLKGPKGKVRNIESVGTCSFSVGEIQFIVEVIDSKPVRSWIDQKIQERTFEQVDAPDLEVESVEDLCAMK